MRGSAIETIFGAVCGQGMNGSPTPTRISYGHLFPCAGGEDAVR
jgi:hypothetical protein